MAVIITNMDMPSKCYECVMRNKSMCGITGLYLPRLDVIRGDCPLKSTDEIKNEIIDKSWNIDMYDSDLDFECMYLSDVLKIVDKYCKGDKDETENNI